MPITKIPSWPAQFLKGESGSSRRSAGILPLIPDPEKPAAFAASKLNWGEAARPGHAEVLEWYRALIRLRKSTPCLNDGTPGKTRAAYDEAEQWLRMERGNISVICNLTEHEQTFPVTRSAEVLLASRPMVRSEKDAIVLPAISVAVLASEMRG